MFISSCSKVLEEKKSVQGRGIPEFVITSEAVAEMLQLLREALPGSVTGCV